MTIKSVNVKSFRNLSNVSAELNGNIAFFGKNRIGKTNLLNAISWCLTGYDLNGKCDNYANIPFDMLESAEDREVCVDVIVELENGKIERQVVFNKGMSSQVIIINGIETVDLKTGELEIDKMLGMLEHKINYGKTITRFLLNPLFFTSCTPKDMRTFVIKCLNVDKNNVYNSLSESVKNVLGSSDIEKVSQDLEKQFKGKKKDMDYWNVVKTYFKDNQDSEDYKLAVKHIEDLTKETLELSDKKVAVDKYASELTKTYDKAVKEHFKGIRIDLLEYNQDGESYKDTFKVISNITNAEMKYCSTSEQIITGCQFISEFAKVENIKLLPIIFDEMETLDVDSLSKIKEMIGTQIITSCVDDYYEKIEVGGM